MGRRAQHSSVRPSVRSPNRHSVGAIQLRKFYTINDLISPSVRARGVYSVRGLG